MLCCCSLRWGFQKDTFMVRGFGLLVFDVLRKPCQLPGAHLLRVNQGAAPTHAAPAGLLSEVNHPPVLEELPIRSRGGRAEPNRLFQYRYRPRQRLGAHILTKKRGPGNVVSAIVQTSHLAVNVPCICPAVLTGPSFCPDLSSDLLTCRQVSLTHFPLRSLAEENGPSDTRGGPGLVKGASVEDRLEKGVHRAR